MPAVALSLVGFRLDSPSLVLQYDTPLNAIQLRCAMRNFSHSGDQTFEDTETFCSPGTEAPGTTKETLEVELLWNYGTTGTYNVLKPLQDQRVTFAFLPNRTAARSVDNPELVGYLYVPFIPFLQADGVKKYSYVPMEFKISGIPVTYYTDPGSGFTDHATL